MDTSQPPNQKLLPLHPSLQVRASQLRSALKRQRRRDKAELRSTFAGRPVKPKTSLVQRRGNKAWLKPGMDPQGYSVSYAKRTGRCLDDAPFRGFFLVAQPYWERVEDYLTQHGLAYEYFHASFINACHKLARALQNSSYRKREWEGQIREILYDHPVPVNRYVEALEIFRRECNPPQAEIVGRPIKSTKDVEHRTAQLALYSVLFTRSERRKHAQERKETEKLAFPALLDALGDIEVLQKGRADGLIDEEGIEGGVSLPLSKLRVSDDHDGMDVD